MKLTISAITFGLVGLAFGQSNLDHPNVKVNNQQTGVHVNPALSGPGFLTNANGTNQSSLRWYRPNVTATPVTSLRLNEINPMKTIIDNTDFGSLINNDGSGNNVGPYDPLPNGVVSATGTWNTPSEAEEALYPYTLPIRRNANPANTAPFNLRNPNPRFPAHYWAATTSSLGGVNQDPRQAINPANLNTFSWTFSPMLSALSGGIYVDTPDPTPKGYALYVWIPAGLVSPGGVARPRHRYWAYEITYGIGQKYVDVVDTEASGAGWVRLGNGGRPTNQLFQYAGLNGATPWPITIKLYNTIPRDGTDQLTETVNAGSPDNRFAVFADAALFSAETDQYMATPTSAGFGTADIRVIGARNERTIDPTTIPSSSAQYTQKPVTVGKGVVTSYSHNFGVEQWRYSPLEDGPFTANFDDTNVRFIYTGGFTPAFDNANARAGQYLKASANTVSVTENVNVNPQTDLADGSYQVQMYVAGDLGGVNYAKGAQYEIIEGGVSAGTFTLDMSGPAGFRTLGNRRYVHSTANPLRVVFYNYTTNATDAGKFIYVDQVRFVGSVGTEITSSPVHASALIRLAPGAVPVSTNVVIVADERGRLHCLDATGNGDGTTTCYWTYPSTTTAANDPNLEPGQDVNDPNNTGVYQKFDGEADTLKANMPTDFDLSTAVIQQMTLPGGGGPRDYLVIGSKNGRVYTIAMEGRGDFNAATHTPGTTFRTMTFPETFPANTPKTTQLGSITSVITATIAGTDVIIFGTQQGRMYCINAHGDFNYSSGAELKSSIIWQYPPANAQTLPAIVGTPVLDAANNRLFFGTSYEDGNPSRFMALDATNGNPLWATTNNSIADSIGTPPTQLDWYSGACYVPASTLNVLPSVAAAMPDTVFAMNQNGNTYAINAATGAVIWRTDELQAGGAGSINYTEMTAYNTGGVPTVLPVILVPTESGRFTALFARLGEETRFGNRQAWGYEMDSSIQASMTISNKWMFGATNNGYLLAWSDLANAGATTSGPGPGNETATDNDPAYDAYRNCEVAFLSRGGYKTLRLTKTGSITGTENYATVIDAAASYIKPFGKVKPPFRSTHGAAFEWGETIYLIAYNFPFSTQDTDGNDVSPPVVEATVTTEGRASRPIAAEARCFADKTSSDPDGGYAIFQIPLTAGGGTAHTPGPGSIRVQLRTSAVNNTNTNQSITLNPALTQLSYLVANPIGISVEDAFRTQPNSTLGDTIDPTREDALLNGTSNVTISSLGSTVLGDYFGKSVGTTAHGSSKKTNVYVLDRSLITLLRGEGRGLELVKVDRRDLRWQGGAAVVAKPFAAIPGLGPLLGNFEDLPVNYPNNSLDYPDIAREQVKVRKEPNGNVENPVYNPVTLKGPVSSTGGVVDDTNYDTRVIVPTIFEFQVDVPKYQPMNLGNSSIANQNTYPTLGMWQAGYAGRFTIFVDSDQSGSFGGGSREAYRTFNLAAAVSPDEKIVIGTPNVDLGSLASGAGYDAQLTYSNSFPYRGPLSPTSFFSPDAPQYKPMFKPFNAFNDGNVNLWNVRLAKGTLDTSSSLYWPWQILSPGNNDDVWLDSAADVHSNIDANFAPVLGGVNNVVFSQKPRVGDSYGRQILVNPTSRINLNIPGSGTALNATGANTQTVITATPPLGMPIGRYSQLMRLVEDTGGTGPGSGTGDQSISIGYSVSSVVPFEAYSDPTFTLSFTVKETQMTGGRSTYTAAGIDSGNTLDPTHPSQWADVQPSGLRTSDGNLILSFASNRPTFYPGTANPNPNNRNNRIYVSQIAGNTLGAADSRGLDSQIRDLNKFVPDDPTNQRWAQGLLSLPSVPDANIFLSNLTRGVATPTEIGGALTADVTYANPVWSTNGDKDLSGAVQSRLYVAYTGTAKRQTNTGIVDDSRIIVSRLNLSGPGGGTFVLDADPFALKGRPTMVQNGNDLTIVYPALSNGVWSLYLTTFNENTGFSIPVMLQFGSGFESVSSPALVLRNVQVNGVASTEYDLTFTARVRNSGVNEVFMTRLDPTFNYRTFGTTAVNGQIVETAVYDPKFGAFRARGLEWQGAYDITANGTSILSSTPVVDRQTKLQTANTIFGGKVAIDTTLGTIKFSSTSLPKTLALQVMYTPTFMRLSETGTAGYTSPSVMFDSRLEHSNTSNNYAFWRTPSGAGSEPSNSVNTFADRLVVSAVKSASSGGQTARPAMSTYRLGVRIGRAILTNADDGSLAETVTVTGNSGSYQIDPAAGRIYFTRYDEDKVVNIQLGGAGSVAPVNISRPVTFVGETGENFITMETALNESNLYMFLDPVGTATNRRGMIWMLWSSTRNGAPNIFMQSIARKIIPVLPSN